MQNSSFHRGIGGKQDTALDEELRRVEEHYRMKTADDTTEDKQFDSAHLLSFMKQYLSRALPAAAQRTGALIALSPGNGAFAHHLGIGLAAQPTVQAVAITPFSKEPLPVALNFNITHHVILRRSLMSRVPKSSADESVTDVLFRTPDCSGWAPRSEDDPHTCVCGESAEWHLPYPLFRKAQRSRFCQKNSLHAPKQERQVPFCLRDVTQASLQKESSKIADDRKFYESLLSEEPNCEELDGFCQGLVNHLHAGMRPDMTHYGKKGDRHAPERPQAPVVVVLFGGNLETTKYYLAKCISRRHTVLVMDGSGGYADRLCALRNKIEKVYASADRDTLQQFSVALDPLTAEILTNPDLVRFINKSATNEEVVRQIEGALKGDGALHNAWVTYSLYESNAHRQQWNYTFGLGFMIVMSLMVTFLTALQTFLLLRMKRQGQDPPPTLPEQADERGETLLAFWTLMQWSVIVLPVVISAAQALHAKNDHAGKWIALCTTSERLLSEIYGYRTSTLLYKEEEVERHKRAGAAGTAGTLDRVYRSKEDLLQQKAHELTEQLMSGACRQLTLEPYLGSVPPRHILKVDDGYSALTPDHYVRVRLRHSADILEANAARFDKIVSLFHWCVSISSGGGTGLAAFAAYADGSLQAWLALTTAVVATLLRLLDAFRWEFQVRKNVESARQLRNVGAWWSSLGPRADTKENRDILVEQVEGVIKDNIDSWAQQLGQALEKMKEEAKKKGSAEGGANDGESGAAGDEKNAAAHAASVHKTNAALKDIGFAELSHDSLAQLVSSHTIGNEETIRQLVLLKSKLRGAEDRTPAAIRKREMEKVAQSAKDEVAQRQTNARRNGEVVSVYSQLAFPTLAEGIVLPEHLAALARDPSLASMFYDALARLVKDENEKSFARRVGFQELRSAFLCTTVRAHVSTMSHRHTLELAKQLISNVILFSFASIGGEHLTLRVLTIRAQETSEEFVVGELRALAATPNMELMPVEAVLQLIEDSRTRTLLAELPESASLLRKLLNAIREMFHEDVRHLYLQRIAFLIAEIDVDLMMSTPTLTASLANACERISQCGLQPESLSRGDLLHTIPEVFRGIFAKSSHLQLSSYVNCVMLTRGSLYSVDTLLRLVPALFTNEMRRFLRQNENQLRFASVVEQLTQWNVLRLPRRVMIARMQLREDDPTDRSLKDHLEGQLLSNFRLALSMIHTYNTSTYFANLLDRGADLLTSLSLRDVLDHENRVRLGRMLPVLNIRAIQILAAQEADLASSGGGGGGGSTTFSGTEGNELERHRLLESMDFAKRGLEADPPSKMELLRLFPYPGLAKTFDTLNERNIVSIFFAFNNISSFDWTMIRAAVVIKKFAKDKPETKYLQIISAWDETTVQRLVWMSALISSSRMRSIELKESESDASGRGRRGSLTTNPFALVSSSFSGDTSSIATGMDVSLNERVVKLKQLFGAAYDDVVVDALKALTVSHSVELMRMLQPFGVDADVAKFFGNTLDASGYGAADTKTIQDACESWQSRQCLMVALGTLFQTNFYALSDLDFKTHVMREARAVKLVTAVCDEDFSEELLRNTAVNQTTSRMWHALRTTVLKSDGNAARGHREVPSLEEEWMLLESLEPTRFRDYFYTLFNDIRLTAPLTIFYRLADVCDCVDLRELFGTVEARTDFIVLMSLACYMKIHVAVPQKRRRSNTGSASNLGESAAVMKAMWGGRNVKTDREQQLALDDCNEDRQAAQVVEPDASMQYFQKGSLLRAVAESGSFTVGPPPGAQTLAQISGWSQSNTPREGSFNSSPALTSRESPRPTTIQGSTPTAAAQQQQLSDDDVWVEEDFIPYLRPIYSDFESIEGRVMGLVPEDDAAESNQLKSWKANGWRLLVMQRLTSEFQKEGFSESINVLHSLSEPLLRYLFKCHRRVLQSTMGNFFSHVMAFRAKRDSDPLTPSTMGLREAFAFDNAVANLVRNVKLFPKRFTASLSRLDADRFYERGQGTGHQDKALALAEWMTTGSEGPRQCIASYSRKQLRILFDMLALAKPDNEQSALAQTAGVKPYGWFVRELFSDQVVSWKKILRPRSAAARLRREGGDSSLTASVGRAVAVRMDPTATTPPQSSLAADTSTQLPTVSQVIAYFIAVSRAKLKLVAATSGPGKVKPSASTPSSADKQRSPSAKAGGGEKRRGTQAPLLEEAASKTATMDPPQVVQNLTHLQGKPQGGDNDDDVDEGEEDDVVVVRTHLAAHTDSSDPHTARLVDREDVTQEGETQGGQEDEEEGEEAAEDEGAVRAGNPLAE